MECLFESGESESEGIGVLEDRRVGGDRREGRG